MVYPVLYRKRIIPEECILLKDDEILLLQEDILVTKWNTIKPRKDLHHGFSCYFLNKGYKISKFYRNDGSLLYYYCDIIKHDWEDQKSKLVVTDLLADVIIYPDGFVKVVDLDEIVTALNEGGISDNDLKWALLSLNNLLTLIYQDKLDTLVAPINQFDSSSD